jgi:hypothetical protein
MINNPESLIESLIDYYMNIDQINEQVYAINKGWA